jgi:HTH-type transcriptional regulator/antitoxin HigA
MNAVTIDYGELLSQTKPEVVTGDRQHQLYIEQLERLTGQAEVSPAQEKLIHLLTVLVEDYQTRNFPIPDAGPLAIVRHLMEAHHLRQKDLVDVFGTESIVSDVLNGKRDLTKEHIRRLSHRFHVSPSVFF